MIYSDYRWEDSGFHKMKALVQGKSLNVRLGKHILMVPPEIMVSLVETLNILSFNFPTCRIGVLRLGFTMSCRICINSKHGEFCVFLI